MKKKLYLFLILAALAQSSSAFATEKQDSIPSPKLNLNAAVFPSADALAMAWKNTKQLPGELDLPLLMELNIKAASIWENIFSCSENNIEKAIANYRNNSFQCGTNSTNTTLKNEISSLHAQINDFFSTSYFATPSSKRFFPEQLIHPLFIEILHESLALNLHFPGDLAAPDWYLRSLRAISLAGASANTESNKFIAEEKANLVMDTLLDPAMMTNKSEYESILRAISAKDTKELMKMNSKMKELRVFNLLSLYQILSSSSCGANGLESIGSRTIDFRIKALSAEGRVFFKIHSGQLPAQEYIVGECAPTNGLEKTIYYFAAEKHLRHSAVQYGNKQESLCKMPLSKRFLKMIQYPDVKCERSDSEN